MPQAPAIPIRIIGWVWLALAVVFSAAAVWALSSGFTPSGLIIALNAVVIGFWGVYALRTQAPRFDELARDWDGMAARYAIFNFN